MKGYSDRIDRIEEYYFSKKLKKVKELAAAGRPIINMGIGSPDLPPHSTVIQAMKDVAGQPHVHGYQGYQGIPELRKAFSDFYRRHYQVSLSPNDEILPLMGSKEGIAHISMAFLNHGDEVLIPNPGYPTYTSVTRMLMAEPVYYTLSPDNGWYPDIEQLERRDLSKVKLMWVNYPHMPTGARAMTEVFAELVAFAKRHRIILINDNPYSFLLEDRPKSIFQIPGAIEVAMELNSLSKSANMAGWRIGALLGKQEWLKAVIKIKSNMDSGMFLPLQQGAIAALSLDDQWYKGLNQVYGRRRELVWALADKLGLSYEKKSVGMFVWARLEDHVDEEIFVDRILYDKSIFITPGHIFGSQGKGYIRLSLCQSEEVIKEAISRF